MALKETKIFYCIESEGSKRERKRKRKKKTIIGSIDFPKQWYWSVLWSLQLFPRNRSPRKQFALSIVLCVYIKSIPPLSRRLHVDNDWSPAKKKTRPSVRSRRTLCSVLDWELLSWWATTLDVWLREIYACHENSDLSFWQHWLVDCQRRIMANTTDT